jgi:hypothetical protein
LAEDEAGALDTAQGDRDGFDEGGGGEGHGLWDPVSAERTACSVEGSKADVAYVSSSEKGRSECDGL